MNLVKISGNYKVNLYHSCTTKRDKLMTFIMFFPKYMYISPIFPRNYALTFHANCLLRR